MISPVSFSRLHEVGTPCGHAYAVRRRPPVTCVVLEVLEVRVRRAESRGRDLGEPEADGPKGECLQDTPDTTNAFSGPATQRNIQKETEAQRTIQMETETNGPFRWTARFQKSDNDRKVVRGFLSILQYLAPSRQPPSQPTIILTINFTANTIVH